MVLKLDLEKAYDRLDRAFIQETPRDACLPTKMIDAIRGVISSNKCQLLWNGELTEQIIPSRRLRHGDPLSSLIIILCVERLSQWIHRQVEMGSWRAIKTSKSGPKVSHKFFADDLLLFVEAGEMHQRGA